MLCNYLQCGWERVLVCAALWCGAWVPCGVVVRVRCSIAPGWVGVLRACPCLLNWRSGLSTTTRVVGLCMPLPPFRCPPHGCRACHAHMYACVCRSFAKPISPVSPVFPSPVAGRGTSPAGRASTASPRFAPSDTTPFGAASPVLGSVEQPEGATYADRNTLASAYHTAWDGEEAD